MERADRVTILVAAGALAGSISSIGTCSTSREIDRLDGAVETLRTDVRGDVADVRADIAEVRADVRSLDDRVRAVEIAIAGTAAPPGE
ncbi:MAG: hypothetical protein J4G16_07480 [Acidobacteria bacterium]|nr:hypothetical protein [Acidobacteriota bacterium]